MEVVCRRSRARRRVDKLQRFSESSNCRTYRVPGDGIAHELRFSMFHGTSIRRGACTPLHTTAISCSTRALLSDIVESSAPLVSRALTNDTGAERGAWNSDFLQRLVFGTGEFLWNSILM